MHLSEIVTNSDCDFAVKVMLESFISTQKRNAQRQLRA